MAQYMNDEWVDLLSGEPDNEALETLRALLVRGLRYTLSSRVNSNLDALVEDFTQEALLKILDKLDSFRGESQFTTWAQKIAVRVALTELRRKRWKDTSLDALTTSADGTSILEPAILSDPGPSPEDQTSQQGMIYLVQKMIAEELTERQRQAIVAVMLEGKPMDVVAAEMNTNRNALYKLIHDARLRLKRKLSEAGITADEVLATFA